MFMKNLSATLLILSRMNSVHRDAERRAETGNDISRRTARPGGVIDTIVASISLLASILRPSMSFMIIFELFLLHETMSTV